MWLKLREFLCSLNTLLTNKLLWVWCEHINSLVNPLSREGLAGRLNATSGTLTLLIYNKAADFSRTRVRQSSIWWILWFMWFRKKEIYLQIKEYGQNQEFLIELAQHTQIKRIQDINRDMLKSFYKQRIEPQASTFYRLQEVKFVNKFLRVYGVPFILGTEEVVEITPNDAIVEAMKTVSKHNPTPKTRRNRRIVQLVDRGWSYSEICAEMGLRAKSTIYEIYHREKNRME